MNKLAIITLCLLSLTLVECKTSSKSTATKVPTAPPATTTTAPVESKPAAQPDPTAAIAMGESIYGAKCADCHKLPTPAQYTQGEWAHIMISMSRKAHLSQTETEQVLAFVNNSAKK